jgi:hypothetical protein
MSNYIGKTTNVAKRFKDHYNKTNNANSASYNYPLYETIRCNGGWSNWNIMVIDECSYSKGANLERHYINIMKSDLNQLKYERKLPKTCRSEKKKQDREIEMKKYLAKLELNKSTNNIYPMDFTDAIRKKKPDISAGSLKTYNSLLRSIYTNVFGKDSDPEIKKFDNHGAVMKWLMEKPYKVRKTFLAALISVTSEPEPYRTEMLKNIKEYRDDVDKSEMTEKLEQSAISQEEIDGISEKLRSNFEAMAKKKSHRVADLMEMQNYVILSLYYGHIVPRRSLDYVVAKYKNYDKETENYVDFKKNKLVFNIYKTAKKNGKELKGRQELDLPPSLKKILQKWVSVIPPEIDSLLFNSNLEELSAVTLNQRLNSIFGGNKAVNSLRHFYLTQKYKELMQANEEMAKTMESMGSSTEQAKIYIRINDKA